MPSQPPSDDLLRKTPRFLTCDHCALEFVYLLPGNTQSLPADAYDTLPPHYADNPARIHEYVRCPNCGSLQRHMVARLRHSLLMTTVTLHGTALLALFTSLPWGTPNIPLPSWLLPAALLTAFSASVTISAARHLDPNRNPLTRLLFPARRAMSRQQYIALRKQRLARQTEYLAAELARRKDKDRRWSASVSQYFSHVKNPH